MSTDSRAERYVAGRMTTEEIAAFEADMMAREDIAADVAVRQRIKAGLSRLEERGELDAVLNAPERPVSRGVAMAASIVVALVVAGLFVWRGREEPASSSLVTLVRPSPNEAHASSFILAATRADARVPEIKVPADGTPIELRLMVDSGSRGPFEVELAGSRMTVSASRDGFVDVELRANKSGSEKFEITVTPASGTAEKFEVELTAAP